MVDGVWTEAVKFWGGLAGIGTAAFILWDRAFRARPWVEPYPYVAAAAQKPLFGQIPDDAVACLRIYNPGPKVVGIGHVQFYSLRGRRRIELRGDVGREVHPRRLMPIAAGETRLFGLIWGDANPSEAPEDLLLVIISWRPLAGLIPRIPLFMRTSIGELERLIEAAITDARATTAYGGP